MNIININDGKIEYKVSLNDGICTSTKIEDLICIGYLYTSAGSNPREFQGMTKINVKILISILEDSTRFWAKHLGISITIKGGTVEYDNNNHKGILRYEDACITNGLQTLFLFRILLIIKIFQVYKKRNEIYQKISKDSEENFKEIIREALPPNASEFLLSTITFSQINKVLYWFYKDDNIDYLNIINKLSIEELLNIRISFKSVLIDEIINSDEENDLSIITKWGEDIANSNNETQNVKVDDKFGTKYKPWLEDNFMCKVSGIIADIEYRKYSGQKKKLPLKHILDILRAIIPTTLVIDYKTSEKINVVTIISKYANNISPVYGVFERLIKISKTNSTVKEIKDVIEIIKNLMPDLLKIMFRFENKLVDFYQKLTFNEVLNNCSQNPNDLKQRLGLNSEENNEEILNKAIKKKLRFSQSNIFPIFIYATRKSIIVNEKLEVKYDIGEDTIQKMINAIYRMLLKERITRQYGSTSDLFRNPELYTEAEYTYSLVASCEEKIDFIEKYRINLSQYK